MKTVDVTLNKLSELIQSGRFEDMESDTLEIKPVPPDGGQWRECHKSVNAFLNTRGGIVIIGIREVTTAGKRQYEYSGYDPSAEPKLKELLKRFTNKTGVVMDLTDCFPSMEIKTFMAGRVALVYVDELSADKKFCFLDGVAYKRILTGDHKLSDSEIESQEEYKEESQQARELQIMPALTPNDLDLDKLNEYIQHLNRVVKIETIKADLDSARSFLERKCFIKDNKVTTLGMLVCGKHPNDHLGFRCQVHGYVDAPQTIAQDKQDFADNILPLMENSLAYILRNIQVGVSAIQGGSYQPQYPEELLRETVNNALAHRDYSINKHVIISIKPGVHISIKNPGAFRKHLLIETRANNFPLIKRIIPEAKPRNPKLADVLRVYRKWEGRGIGMATLVNICLSNQMDLPFYRFYTEEVCLYLRAGKLLDEKMERLFQGFDRYLQDKLNGADLTVEQKLILSYLLKSERVNEQNDYAILLTHDNNHCNELLTLETAGLIIKHADSPPLYPIYYVDRTLAAVNYLQELRIRFKTAFDDLNQIKKNILTVVYRFNNFSKARVVSAKQAAYVLWYEGMQDGSIEEFDVFYRRIRNAFNALEQNGFVRKIPKNGKIRAGYELTDSVEQSLLV